MARAAIATCHAFGSFEAEAEAEAEAEPDAGATALWAVGAWGCWCGQWVPKRHG